MKRLGIRSFKDFIFTLLMVAIFALVSYIFYGAAYQLITGRVLYNPSYFGVFDSNIQFPYLLMLCVGLMYLATTILFLLGFASLFYKDKKDRLVVSEEKLVSVLIPSHNEATVIQNLLYDLLDQKYQNFEIIVIPHNCSDATAKKAAEVDDERIKVIEFKSLRSGKALALNRGFKESSGEIIVHFDSDNRIKDKYFLHRLVAHFEDEDVSAIQSRLGVTNYGESILTMLQKIEFDIFSSIALAGREVLGLPCLLAGTGTALKRDTVKDLGGWNNYLVEDYEMFTRMTKKGLKIKFADNLLVFDEKPESWGSLLTQRSRWIKGHMQVAWDYIAEFGNLFDYIYRFLTFSAFAWWISVILYLFYFLSGQFSVWDAGDLFWIMWTVGFLVGLLMMIWKVGGWKKIVYLIPYFAFTFHWLLASILSLGNASWAKTKTNHNGEFTKRSEGVRDND